MASDLRSIISSLGAAARERRDCVLLVLGWAAALRRNELIQLDWMSVGSGKGVVVIERDAVVISLRRTKTMQDCGARIVLSSNRMPAAFNAVSAWVEMARLPAGTPFLRAVDRHGRVSETRLSARSVSRIVQARVQAHLVEQGCSEPEARQRALRYSGHSLRSGLISSAAAEGIPGHLIAQHSRHRSQRALARYIREQDVATVLGRVGF